MKKTFLVVGVQLVRPFILLFLAPATTDTPLEEFNLEEQIDKRFNHLVDTKQISEDDAKVMRGVVKSVVLPLQTMAMSVSPSEFEGPRRPGFGLPLSEEEYLKLGRPTYGDKILFDVELGRRKG